MTQNLSALPTSSYDWLVAKFLCPQARVDEISEILWSEIEGLQGIEEGPADGSGCFKSPRGMEILEFGSAAAEAADSYLEKEEFRGGGDLFLRAFVSGQIESVKARFNVLLETLQLSKPGLVVEKIESRDYLKSYQEQVRGVRFGRENNLWVGPPWECKAPENCLAFWVEPAMAFGTGEHPTTQMCLEKLWDLKNAGLSPDHILDLGTGTGLLAVAARILFPKSKIVALDTDALCEESFHRTCELNAVNPSDFSLGFGSEKGNVALLNSKFKFDLILSNIYAEVLAGLKTEIQSRLKSPMSRWIASGILEGESEAKLVSAVGSDLVCLVEQSNLRKGPDGSAEVWKLYEWQLPRVN